MRNWLICIIIVLLIAIFAGWRQVRYANERWERAEANVKAYSSQLSNMDKKNSAFELTIDQLEYFNDSILRQLNETRESLKIKDKNLQSLHSVSSSFTRTDTLVMKDTIYRDPSFSMDTVIGDDWYKSYVGLKYPSTVTLKPEFRSQKDIIVFSRRETVNPPKKFFLWRWFQKRHTVLQVEVIEKNPYVMNESSKFVKIVK